MTKYIPDSLRSLVLYSKQACLAQVSESSFFRRDLVPSPGTACTPLEPKLQAWAPDQLTPLKGAIKTLLGARQPERRLHCPLRSFNIGAFAHALFCRLLPVCSLPTCKLPVRGLQHVVLFHATQSAMVRLKDYVEAVQVNGCLAEPPKLPP
jgi:hypothetical protein